MGLADPSLVILQREYDEAKAALEVAKHQFTLAENRLFGALNGGSAKGSAKEPAHAEVPVWTSLSDTVGEEGSEDDQIDEGYE